MRTDLTQRWRDRRDSYRPAGEPIRTAEYDVVELPGAAEARAFVLAHHYSGTWPSDRFRFGLYHQGEGEADGLVGVAVFSHPVRNEVLTSVFPGEPLAAAELGRFVLRDDVPANGETWFLARCFEVLRRQGLGGVVSFADPVPRTDAHGRVFFPGHVGTIYQAGNGVPLGRARARTLQLLPDGTVLSERAQAKIRAREKGWRYASALLVAHGAAPLGEAEDAAAWLARWTARLCRPLRHGGNYRYAWDLTPRRVYRLAPRNPYPKRPDPVPAYRGTPGEQLGLELPTPAPPTTGRRNNRA